MAEKMVSLDRWDRPVPEEILAKTVVWECRDYQEGQDLTEREDHQVNAHSKYYNRTAEE